MHNLNVAEHLTGNYTWYKRLSIYTYMNDAKINRILLLNIVNNTPRIVAKYLTFVYGKAYIRHVWVVRRHMIFYDLPSTR